jgi:hypothetical protein
VTLLVDDEMLGSVLRGDPLPADDQPVFTTGCWYVRLCGAVLGRTDPPGRLSSPFIALPPGLRDRAERALLELPDAIGLLSLRDLSPLMGRLRRRHDLNLLSLEALAAALQLGATVSLSSSSPRLEAALASEGCPVTLNL